MNHSVSQWAIDIFKLDIATASPSFASFFSSWFITARLGRLVTVYRTNVDSRLATLFFDFQWNFSSCDKAADWSQCILRLECEQWCPLAGGVCNLAWRMVFSPIWGLINCFGVRSPAFAAMLGPSMHPAQYTWCIPCIHGPGIPVCNLQPPGYCCFNFIATPLAQFWK